MFCIVFVSFFISDMVCGFLVINIIKCLRRRSRRLTRRASGCRFLYDLKSLMCLNLSE